VTRAPELEQTRAAPLLLVAAVPLADVTWLLLVWSWLFTLDGPIATTVGASVIGLSIALALICGAARLAPRDIGLSRRSLLGGLAVGAAFWLAVQLVHLVAALVTGMPLAVTPHLSFSAQDLVVQQIAGNALAEEVVFRGFLLVQFALLARRSMPRRTAWLVALFASQVVFALTHIPARWVTMDIHGSALLANLVLTGGYGVFYSLIYLRTGMLGLAVAYHALDNVPLQIVDSPLDAHAVAARVMIVLLVAWPLLTRARR